MNIFQVIFRLVRRGLILLLGTYWVAFVGYTIKNLVAGGPGAVVVWYRHIAGAAFQWDWRVFLAQQVLTLAITVLLCLFERRILIKERRTSDQSANRTSKV